MLPDLKARKAIRTVLAARAVWHAALGPRDGGLLDAPALGVGRMARTSRAVERILADTAQQPWLGARTLARPAVDAVAPPGAERGVRGVDVAVVAVAVARQAVALEHAVVGAGDAGAGRHDAVGTRQRAVADRAPRVCAAPADAGQVFAAVRRERTVGQALGLHVGLLAGARGAHVARAELLEALTAQPTAAVAHLLEREHRVGGRVVVGVDGLAVDVLGGAAAAG